MGPADLRPRRGCRLLRRNALAALLLRRKRQKKNVEEIAAVDGVDMLFVGPNDVAAYMGHAPFGHAEIPGVDEAAATARVLKAGLDAGKYVGHFATDADAAAARCKQGFHFVNCGADSIAIERWMSGEMGRLKSLISEDVSGKQVKREREDSEDIIDREVKREREGSEEVVDMKVKREREDS